MYVLWDCGYPPDQGDDVYYELQQKPPRPQPNYLYEHMQ